MSADCERGEVLALLLEGGDGESAVGTLGFVAGCILSEVAEDGLLEI